MFGCMFLVVAMSWAGFATALAVLYNDQRVRKDFAGSVPLAPGELS